MLELKNYRAIASLYESNKSFIYRGYRAADGLPVILKALKQDYPSSEELTRYRQEFALTSALDLDGAIRAYAIERHENTPVIVLEDFGAESLSVHLGGRPLEVGQFLTLAVQIADSLGQIHQERVIHKDINPSNIAWNPGTGELKLIDFGISTRLPQEEPSLKNPSVVEGTLPYMSPEQTGRMNRALDYRTDFYSVGVTFYEMLTGVLPFEGEDALALVHCHIARHPAPPSSVRPEIPAPISDVVMKLLEKNAENRYQSAWGLKADLEECLLQWHKGARIEPFPLGRRDISGRFQIPQKLYGRDREIRELLAAFDRVSAAGEAAPPPARMMLVAGYSGIGKSALVREIYRPITEKRGYFIAGKFDQFQRTIPYSAVAGALSDLVRQLLTESPPRLADWRKRILAAVGPNGHVITDMIPDVELLIGPQPAVERLGATESLNRFNLVFQNFIQVFCKGEHPLVLFLDDLQWADTPSLKLIELIMMHSQVGHLLLIGAYRDNEVDGTHPLTTSLEGLRKGGALVGQITLSPLSLEHVSHLIADALGESAAAVASLAALTLTKTNGNPFFVRQFLNTLHSEKKLGFSLGRWQWDIAQIEGMGITDNVVDLMIRKMKRLPDATVRALRLAACVGNRFELATLSIISERPRLELFRDLLVAMQEGLVVATSKLEALSSDPTETELLILHFKFAHDRVQQAAYAFIEDERKPAVHLRIGRVLLANASPLELSVQIFDIMEHCNLGAALVTDPEERYTLAGLNWTAGTKAKEAGAYLPALGYLQAGLSMLRPEGWEERYELTFNLHVAAVEVLYLNADMIEAKRLSGEVLKRAQSLLDRVKVHELQMMASVAQNQHAASIETAREALALLGLRLPSEPAEAAAAAEELRREIDAKVTSIEGLFDLPEMTDPYQLAKLRILMRLAPPAYNAAPFLLPTVIFNKTKLCVLYGNSPMACTAYVWHAIVVGGYYADIDASYQYGLLSVKILEKYGAVEFKAKIHNLFNAFVRQWKEHVRETMAPMMEGFHSGMETGDIEFGLYSAIQYCNNLLFIGDPLKFVARQRGEMYALAARLKQNYHEDYFSVGNQMVQNLLGQSADPCLLVGEVLDETQKLPLWESVNNVTFSFIAYTCKTVLNYMFKRPGVAVEMARKAERYAPGGAGLFYSAVQVFYSSLAHLAHCAELDPGAREEHMEKVRAQQERLLVMAKHAPMNFQHKHDLVEAERARLEGRHHDAMDLYERALRGARQQGFLQEEALAYELAAELYLALDRQDVARVYMSKAYHGYVQWEAKAKADHLRAMHPQLVTRTARLFDTNRTQHKTSTSSTTQTGPSNLDIATVLKASQAISGEIVLGRLLEGMLAIMMENAGAERGALLAARDGELFIEAVGTVQDGVSVLGSATAASAENLAVTVVQYVARTGEAVVLDDASNIGRFQQDPYVVGHKLLSILCLPIVKQSRRLGILYLENNVVTGAFSPERLDVLEVLSTQAAISLENARLYDTLEQKVDQRTAQLRAKNDELASALDTLQRTQKQLVTQEKLASLGQLTAGIAHEIRNPLNFVANFSESSMEILGELAEDLRAASNKLPPSVIAQIEDTTSLLTDNLRKVAEHGQRANRIVHSMLMHAQASSDEPEPADINEILSESMRLAHHGLRAKMVDLLADYTEDYDPSIGPVDVVPSDMGRVFLNIIQNACYAVGQKQRTAGRDYRPQISLRTRSLGDRVEIRIRDNGPGIPQDILDKVFNPFFTTKPTGDGTGLGLSISHDIVTQTHHGELRVDTVAGQYAEFVITIPKRAPDRRGDLA